jgi:hypothetical protein
MVTAVEAAISAPARRDGAQVTVTASRILTYSDDKSLWRAHRDLKPTPAAIHQSAAVLAWDRLRSAGIDAPITTA